MSRVVLIVALCLMPAIARAQVTVNPAALQQLAGFVVPAPQEPPPVIRHVVHPAVHRLRPRAAVVMVKPRAVTAKPAVFKPVVPAAPPVAPAPVPVVAKPVVPAAPAVAPVPVPVIAKPVLPAPLVVTFSTGSAALPGDAGAGLKPFCAAKGATLIIDAYAPGDPSDPSAAMRLSLNRAFALRQALTACGVPGAQIIPRADGAAGSNLESARVFISGTGQ